MDFPHEYLSPLFTHTPVSVFGSGENHVSSKLVCSLESPSCQFLAIITPGHLLPESMGHSQNHCSTTAQCATHWAGQSLSLVPSL